nr:hypothetical protein [Tanacetum cinerariifolium]
PTGKSPSWYFPCICWLGCRDMSVACGVHALYPRGTQLLCLCQASTDATDSGTGSSFEEPTLLEYASGLGRACLARVTSYVYVWRAFAILGSFLCRLKQSHLHDLIKKYNILLDLRHRLPPSDEVMSKLPNVVIGTCMK